MKEKYPKIGDRITIIRRHDTIWSSGAGGIKPDISIKYPFTGQVISFVNTSHPAVNVDGWGFDMKHVEWKYAEEEVYEIY